AEGRAICGVVSVGDIGVPAWVLQRVGIKVPPAMFARGTVVGWHADDACRCAHGLMSARRRAVRPVELTMNVHSETLPVTQWRDVIHMEQDVQLAVCGWVPNRPKTILLLSHGYADHPGRHSHVVNPLVADGFAVYGIDHRGHGRSSGVRALITDFDRTADELYVLATRAQQRHLGLPTVLVGNSMGGLIALRYALRYPEVLGALVTIAPALIIDQNSSRPEVLIGKLIGTIAPAVPHPYSPTGDCSTTTDPEICRQFAIDHRTWHGHPRIGAAAAMLRAGEDTLDRLGEITTPLLAMHGTEDTLADPCGTELMRKRVGSQDKTVFLLEGMRHELFNEPDRARVIGVVRSWLAERFG
ncbi:MAG TPA: alpha/beta hydrolase, partial [Thermomicrobiales bacterium]|nr:alpha/beta hydrolase [Thermomicrobiales bacterium]